MFQKLIFTIILIFLTTFVFGQDQCLSDCKGRDAQCENTEECCPGFKCYHYGENNPDICQCAGEMNLCSQETPCCPGLFCTRVWGLSQKVCDTQEN